MEAWPCRRECGGHDPAKKRICCAGATCFVGKLCTFSLLRDNVWYIGPEKFMKKL